MPTKPPSFDSTEEYTTSLCSFVQSPFFRQITGGIHVNDALIYDAWGSLPADWTSWWLSLPDLSLARQDLIRSISVAKGNEDRISQSNEPELVVKDRPSSLADWLSQVRSLALPRVPLPTHKLDDLPDVLVTAFNTKKTAEVTIATEFIEQSCGARGISRVVDIGSGQGYLPATLAFLHPQTRVLAIDGDPSQVAGSQRLAASLHIDETRLKHVIHHVDGGPTLIEKIEGWAQSEPCILTGLHACGSLSEHMIRCFVSTPCIQEIAVIGCCYNHIQRRSDGVGDGFPISRRMQALDVDLSPTALMTGCQAPENWPQANKRGGSNHNTKRHFYRALLEKIFFDHDLRSSHTQSAPWRIRKGDLESFEAFSRRAMAALNIDAYRVSSETLQLYELQYQRWEDRIAILWTLSVLCCKVVESVIAMDRYWYLREQGIWDVDIVPIFDYTVSPRNLMITARKP